jgi:hypothetical protein
LEETKASRNNNNNNNNNIIIIIIINNNNNIMATLPSAFNFNTQNHYDYTISVKTASTIKQQEKEDIWYPDVNECKKNYRALAPAQKRQLVAESLGVEFDDPLVDKMMT